MKILLIIMVALLLVCLVPMPYGYYQLVRFIAMAVFAYLAYEYYKVNRVGVCYIFVALALLFQPFFKVALVRTVCNIVDVIEAAFLMVLLLVDKKREV